MTRPLTPKSLKCRPCFAIIFVLYLEHGAVHGIGACFVLKISFWVTEGIEALSRLRTSRKQQMVAAPLPKHVSQ